MGRIRTNVKINGREAWALFDTGARNTYVVSGVASLLPVFDLQKPEPVALGGKAHQVKKNCYLSCLVEGFPVRTHARVLEDIGVDEEGKSIEVLVGALAMQEWGIELNLKKEQVELPYYPKEFVEF